MHEGARRLDDHVAMLSADGVLLDKVDGQNPKREAQFTPLPPGTHALVLSLDDRFPATTRYRERRLSVRPLALCFLVSAGHSYVAKPTYHGWQWKPDIFDEVLGAPVQAQAADAASSDCSARVDEITAEAIAKEPLPSAAAPNLLSRSADFETDRDYVDPRRAGTGITLEAGMFLWGDNLGSGMSVSLGAQWTPWWIEDMMGIGVGASFGYKGNSLHTSEGNVARSRYPLVATVHGLARITDGWFLLLRGGIQSDIHVSADVPVSGQINSPLGFLGEGGVYWPFSRHLAGSMAFRYTSLRYSSDRDGFSANSLGPLCTLYIVL
jgi:hypothetical protein